MNNTQACIRTKIDGSLIHTAIKNTKSNQNFLYTQFKIYSLLGNDVCIRIIHLKYKKGAQNGSQTRFNYYLSFMRA